jgi:predicted nucleic acid-binding protein
MILVESSVWIDLLNNVVTEPVHRLRELIPTRPLLVGDLILLRFCRIYGSGTGETGRALAAAFRRHISARAGAGDQSGRCCATNRVRIRTQITALQAANYRLPRRRGITIRKTIDLIIGTFCIERGHALLHSDRDFEPMQRLLGLETV